MQKADLTTRAVAGFIDLLIVIALARLPDVIGFLAAVGYILVRDGLFDRQSIGKKVIGIRIVLADTAEGSASFRESIIRNVTLAVAFLLFRVPYAGWFLGPLVLSVESLAALGARVEAEGRVLAVEVPPGGSFGPVLEAVAEARLPVGDVETRRATLEDVFVSVRGAGERGADP